MISRAQGCLLGQLAGDALGSLVEFQSPDEIRRGYPDGVRELADGGIDVRGTLVVGDVVRIKMAVQVKKWKLKNNIQAPVVQQVRGSLGAHEQGLIITTSDFSPGAVKEAAQADKTPIALMNGDQLVMLLMEHGMGVHRSTPDLFEIDEEFGTVMK